MINCLKPIGSFDTLRWIGKTETSRDRGAEKMSTARIAERVLLGANHKPKRIKPKKIYRGRRQCRVRAVLLFFIKASY